MKLLLSASLVVSAVAFGGDPKIQRRGKAEGDSKISSDVCAREGDSGMDTLYDTYTHNKCCTRSRGRGKCKIVSMTIDECLDAGGDGLCSSGSCMAKDKCGFCQYGLGCAQTGESPDGPPTICCMAMIASCLACQDGLTVPDYCLENPMTQGCPRKPNGGDDSSISPSGGWEAYVAQFTALGQSYKDAGLAVGDHYTTYGETLASHYIGLGETIAQQYTDYGLKVATKYTNLDNAGKYLDAADIIVENYSGAYVAPWINWLDEVETKYSAAGADVVAKATEVARKASSTKLVLKWTGIASDAVEKFGDADYAQKWVTFVDDVTELQSAGDAIDMAQKAVDSVKKYASLYDGLAVADKYVNAGRTIAANNNYDVGKWVNNVHGVTDYYTTKDWGKVAVENYLDVSEQYINKYGSAGDYLGEVDKFVSRDWAANGVELGQEIRKEYMDFGKAYADKYSDKYVGKVLGYATDIADDYGPDKLNEFITEAINQPYNKKWFKKWSPN